VAPALGSAHVERCWAGLRPGSPDGLPLLGRVGDAENLYVAAGHYRNGLQMSPGTARVMRQLILGQTPEIALEGFAPDRAFG
jgi:glycine oxidase